MVARVMDGDDDTVGDTAETDDDVPSPPGPYKPAVTKRNKKRKQVGDGEKVSNGVKEFCLVDASLFRFAQTLF